MLRRILSGGMICMVSSNPVSPHASSISSGGAAPQPEQGEKAAQEEEEEEIVDFDKVQSKAVLEGAEQKEAPLATALPSPPSMTPAEREQHNLTHQPPHR